MLSSKLSGYLGFAAKSRGLQTGYNTNLLLIEKRRVKLLIVAEDASQNTKKKMTQKCKANETEYRIFGTKEDLSKITGRYESSTFAITDDNFSKVIKDEIDRIQSEREVFL
ncbi:MAG: L7Ae/L30e/S12e/Gadd45 family ribosomal protein [Hornefia sp.]|nr:L7Ae/L30e/S12e/Gadd45 family ribosomal protein [Hornefia sp.]